MDWDVVAAGLPQTLPLGEKAVGISKEPQRNFWTSLFFLSPQSIPELPHATTLPLWAGEVLLFPYVCQPCVELSDRI